MTIYTARTTEKNDEKDLILPPEVIAGTLPYKKDSDAELGIVAPSLVTVTARPRRNNCANLCVLFTALVVLATGILGGIYLYKHLAHRTFRGWCSVRYYEYQNDGELSAVAGRQSRHQVHKHYGQIEEKVEIDKVDGAYEKIDMPDFELGKRATVLHDFEKNLTAIVDKDNFRCYMMPLNRTNIKPPKDFWDMLNKLSTGYYMPDVEVVRIHYQTRYPPLRNLSPYGYYIWHECHRFETYQLDRISKREPIAMVKRSIRKNRMYGIGGGNILEVVQIYE